MPNASLKHYLHLHVLVVIAGFTAILGELISIGSIKLVWYRMIIAGLLMGLYIFFRKINLKVKPKQLLLFFIAGVIIALHWITFFEAINQSNVSLTLAMFSTGAFFAALIEPLFYKRHIKIYEIVFGLIVIIGVYLITSTEWHQSAGIILGLLSALFSSLFAIINGRFIKSHRASVISFYEFISGVLLLTVFIIFSDAGFNREFFLLPKTDWIYIFILASLCTTYAFIAVVNIMKYVSPYSVIISYNLEPVYGILLAILMFPEQEQMSIQFYLGTALIIAVVLLDGIYKNIRYRRTKALRKP